MMNEHDNMATQGKREGANGPITKERLREMGLKSSGPILKVVYKYKDEFTPYLEALAKGLQSGAQNLETENATEAEKYVSRLFREASGGISLARQKFGATDFQEITDYVRGIAEKKPGLMFSASYIAGVFFGRLSRHIVSTEKEKGRPSDVHFSTDSRASKQSIH